MLTETKLNSKEFIGKSAVKGQKPPVMGAAKLAILRVLHGLKDFPCNTARKEFVRLFFNNDVIPYYNPHMKDTLATPADVTPEDAAPEGQVSDNCFSKERELEMSDAKQN